MDIPRKELEYYLGKRFEKVNMPEVIKKLQTKGILVNGQMTLEEMFDMVREAYAEEIRKKTESPS